MNTANTPSPSKQLGRIARRSDPRTINLAHYMARAVAPPPISEFWAHRAAFPLHTWGNDQIGDCTIAKQANMFLRYERLEQKRTIIVPEEEPPRVYFALTARLYGGGDTGAYEEDALDNARRADLTIRDNKGRPLTIDAYTRFDVADLQQTKQAIYAAAGHGVAICINLPTAFQTIEPPQPWDIPAGQPLTGPWEPGSWGGHSMWCVGYDSVGPDLAHTWGLPIQKITWRAWSAYVDEGHITIDSMDLWRKRPEPQQMGIAIDAIADAVNQVSPVKVH